MQEGQLRMQIFYFNMIVITLFAQIIYRKSKTNNILLKEI